MFKDLTEQNTNKTKAELKARWVSCLPLAIYLHLRCSKESRHARPVISRDGGIEIPSPDDPQWHDMSDILTGIKDTPRYCFSRFHEPFAEYSQGIPRIDLVLEDSRHPQRQRPLELMSTAVGMRSSVGTLAPKLTIRPACSAHAMMSVATSLRRCPSTKDAAVAKLQSVYDSVYPPPGQSLNDAVARKHGADLEEAFVSVLEQAEAGQQPFLLQLVWQPRGGVFQLEEKKCFDVFVWSDVAVMRMPVAGSLVRLNSRRVAGGRQFREIVRHVKGLYELLTNGCYDYTDTYKRITQGFQTASFDFEANTVMEYLVENPPRLGRNILNEILTLNVPLDRRLDLLIQAHMEPTAQPHPRRGS